MADQSSQKPAAQWTHHEIRTAENSAAYLLPKIQSIKQVNPNLTILDVGAGSGTISITLARAIPDGHVTATDVKTDILLRAQAISEQECVKNIEFLEADVFKLPFADGTFDITHCHQVLCHLKDPWDALREMLRVTKPGGLVAAREGDVQTECVWPETPGLVKFHDFIAKFIPLSGGSAMAGRQLLGWALKAGAQRNKVTASFGTWSFCEEAEKKIWAQQMAKIIRAGRIRDTGLKSGFSTEDELEEMAKAWEEWEGTDDATLAMMHGEIIVQK
ncbi:S-adenosyl-L-methionine-dependent methyltransferase [Pseudomassariella vexata]|uniref:S-adenosyl-L-methionine-dependent methyltransferase n=1 Tax=Pseudomassariella vexata TaxID=1141098 RepID=A0A1Y2EK90_9PEZI|nr:S-adenosyl-L-methionine-dependent methyltransferase [Pseudomassariella vexata]ORY71961.1 S-adenosyl-L-methionine-dependent methyltransferase [Pseudomassariella vexata]